MKLSLLLLHLLVFQASAKVLTPYDAKGVSKDIGPDDLHRPHLPSRLPSQSPHQKRGTRPKCAPPVHNGAQKRDVYLDMQSYNATLDKRIMTEPKGSTAGDMDTFMVEELSNELVNLPIIWRSDIGNNVVSDTATAWFYEFKKQAKKAFSVGTGGLCGCTTLAIISRKGVYMGHYWESLSFAPEGEDLQPFGTVEKAFQATVIDGLKKGVTGQQKPLKASQIEDEYIRAYLMIPTETWDDVDNGYRDMWDELKKTVGELVPTLKNQELWTQIRYSALDNGIPSQAQELETTARGRILVKFDPNENKKKRAALWIEQRAEPYHNDIWVVAVHLCIGQPSNLGPLAHSGAIFEQPRKKIQRLGQYI